MASIARSLLAPAMQALVHGERLAEERLGARDLAAVGDEPAEVAQRRRDVRMVAAVECRASDTAGASVLAASP